MRVSAFVLLMFAMVGCSGSATESDGSQPQQEAISKKQTAQPPEQTAAAFEAAAVEAVKRLMTPEQLALSDPIVNSVGMVLAPIPAQSVEAGQTKVDTDSLEFVFSPEYLVKITEPFYLSVHEVTQQQYEKVMGVRPWQGRLWMKEGADYPAMYVSWHDAMEFCRKLSGLEGRRYDLPTNSQWVYACRAGTTTTYSFGNDVSKLGEYAWYIENTLEVGEEYAHCVGQKLPNPWGLHEMYGNVWEWCRNMHVSAIHSKPPDLTPRSGGLIIVTSLGNTAEWPWSVLRGGSFYNRPEKIQSAHFYMGQPVVINPNNGFRVARILP